MASAPVCLSEPRGLPGVDLFFFLAFVAFARRGPRTQAERLAAFQEAFFGPTAWTRPYILRYADSLALPRSMLKALFVLCWGRYVANLVTRTACAGEWLGRPIDGTWLLQNQYWHMWRYAIQHVDELEYAT